MNSFRQHFGIGFSPTISKLVVKWPSGAVDELLSPSINTQITLVEGSTNAPPILLGDCNQDNVVNFLDISPFISILSSASFLEQADCNQDGVVSFLDIQPLIQILSNG